MDITLLKQKKQEKGYSLAQISQLSGIPLGTLQKIFTGETKQPRYDTMRSLREVLGIGEETVSYLDVSEEASAPVAAEPSVAYGVKRQGEYTLEDYYALPEDQRVELIDGVFYDMAAPVLLHQRLAGEIYRQIANHIFEQKGRCIPFFAPVDVQLDCDERTMVQPDVGILCDRDKRKGGIIFGAPEFLAEIISPSTRKKDMTLKLQKFANAGVREYWMVDIKKRVILTYFFEADDYPVIYGFKDQIPVRIYDGDLSVDMSLMLPWIEEEENA